MSAISEVEIDKTIEKIVEDVWLETYDKHAHGGGLLSHRDMMRETGRRVAALVEERMKEKLLASLVDVKYDNDYPVRAVPQARILALFAQYEAERGEGK